MGRPPIHQRAMTGAERHRRWRQRHREHVAQATEPSAGSTPPGARPEAADQALIKQLTRGRDQAWKERNEAHRQLDLAQEQCDAALKGIMPPPEMVGDRIQMCWCSFCAKPRDQVKTMIVGSIRRRLFICSECVAICNDIINKSGA